MLNFAALYLLAAHLCCVGRLATASSVRAPGDAGQIGSLVDLCNQLAALSSDDCDDQCRVVIGNCCIDDEEIRSGCVRHLESIGAVKRSGRNTFLGKRRTTDDDDDEKRGRNTFLGKRSRNSFLGKRMGIEDDERVREISTMCNSFSCKMQ